MMKVIQGEEKEEEEKVDAMDDGEDMEKKLVDFRKTLISKQFAIKITRIVDDIIRGSNSNMLEGKTRSIEGSTVDQSPALQFITYVCHVLNLDATVDAEVTILRKSLLNQIGLQEYSKTSSFHNPCESFLLHDVFCAECKECRDVNLCNGEWMCEECETEFDSTLIEYRLVEWCQKKSAQFQLGDLRCSKTKNIEKRSMSRVSESGVNLVCDNDSSEVNGTIRMLRRIAIEKRLEWLEETTSVLLS
jgi:hypothetical protein